MLPDFLKDKTREISYAIIRVAFNVKRLDLRVRLENLAFELMENAAKAVANADSESTNKVLSDISAIDGLVRLAHSIYEIEPVNATILIRELDKFNSAIRQQENAAIAALPDLTSLFSDYPVKEAQNKPDDNKFESNIEDSSSNNLNLEMRQSAIADKIRQKDSCRLKDLLVDFPGVSERTLRYDLQGLCAKGEIERIGNGGPATYYKGK